MECPPIIWAFEIQLDAFLIDIEALKIKAVVFAQGARARMPRMIPMRWLNFQDLRTEVGQEHGRIRTSAKLLEAYYPDTPQRQTLHGKSKTPYHAA
jgi:hypothetical protein